MRGVDLFTMQYLMGHKTITMTQRYSHLCPDHKRQAVEQISGIFSSDTATEPTQITEKENAREIDSLAHLVSAWF
jgi:hypothetical protein